jgi:hypothetical protein
VLALGNYAIINDEDKALSDQIAVPHGREKVKV